MGFEKGQKYTFPVRGSRRMGPNLYYGIDVNGTEQYVKAYTFQKREAPVQLKCICKGINEQGRPTFMQDIASLIAELYKVGDEGDFKVRTQPGNKGYYEVTDENDFCFRLVGYGTEKFYIGQMVRCRITFINLVRVEMELATGYRGVTIPFYDMNKLCDLDTTKTATPRLLCGLFNTNAFTRVSKQYEEGNPLWVMSALSTVKEHMYDMLQRNGLEFKMRLLGAYLDICTNLLENSDYLAHAAQSETEQYQNELAEMIQSAKDMVYALELVYTGKYQDYVSDLLKKLKMSGYIYNPNGRMLVLCSICALSTQRTLSGIIRMLFDVIREQYQNIRFLRVFSRPFIRILDIYVDGYSRRQAGMLHVGDTGELEQIIKALALRLLLAEGESETDDTYKIYQSMLYRYVSMYMPQAENVESLTYKAFEALFGSYTRWSDYTWKALSDMSVLCEKLASSMPALSGEDSEKLSFTGSGVRCIIQGHHIQIRPEIRSREVHNIVPEGIFVSTPVSVMLEDDIPVPQPGASLQEYQRMWNEIYRSLFRPEDADKVTVHRRRMPEVGDEVMVRVIGPSSSSPYEYICRIEEKDFWGSGTINPTKQIVAYNVKINQHSFVDKATGHPYLLKATVERIDANGNIVFTMRPGIARFNTETLDADVRNLVVISRVDQHQYLGITRGGVTMFIPRDETTPQLYLNDYIVANIVSIYPDGNVQGAIAGRAYESFDRTEAFENLISDYADGHLYYGPDNAEDIELINEPLHKVSSAYVRELIWVVDRKGDMQKSLPVRYSYMAVARILARMLGDRQMERFYLQRMALVMVLNNFGDTGKIDGLTMNILLEDSRNLMDSYPELEAKYNQLKIVNSLDDAESMEYLWETSRKGIDPLTRRLASLVLAHNLLDDEDTAILKYKLRTDIYALMNLEEK